MYRSRQVHEEYESLREDAERSGSIVTTQKLVPPRAVRRSRVFRPGDREARGFCTFSILTMIAVLIALGMAGPDLRALLGPIVAIVAALLLYFAVQIRREGHLPIFEAATFFVLAVGAYSIVPLAQFIAGGMEVGPLGDNRIVVYAPTPQEYGGFAWRHVTLIWAFVLAYLPLRGRRLFPLRRPVAPPPATIGVILVMMLALAAWFLFLRLYSGPAVPVHEGGTGTVGVALPHIVLQLTNVLNSSRLILKQCLVMILLLRWHRRAYRWTLIGWIIVEVVMTVAALESRAGTVVLLLTCVVGYHLLVRPLRVARAMAIGAALLLAFLAYGVARDAGSGTSTADRRAIMSAATEFQIVYGTAYDLYRKRENRELPDIPPQLFFADLYRLVPSQLLPFYKWDPSEWYLEVRDLRGTGQGMMFGIIAQAVTGFDYVELLLRALLLAAFYAFAHRMYRRYSTSYWTTMAYLFLLTWAYYVVRSTSFEFFYRLVYYFLPTWASVKVLTVVVTQVRKPFRRAAVRTA